MSTELTPEVCALLGIHPDVADPAVIPLLASLREGAAAMSAVDVTGVEPFFISSTTTDTAPTAQTASPAGGDLPYE